LELRFDRFPKYDELTAILRDFAARHPRLFSLESIGRSHEGRDIWLLTATNADTGVAADKPAFWIDGNIHAAELTASLACLYFLKTLAEGYGSDADVTRLLDTRALYICPRINPDGAEWALADRPRYIRSSTRPYPFDEDPVDGLTIEDVDGDGRILLMRIPDPNGQYKAHPQEPRLMVARDPAEYGGQYWRVLPEGTLANYDSRLLDLRHPLNLLLPPVNKLDVNNFDLCQGGVVNAPVACQRKRGDSDPAFGQGGIGHLRAQVTF